MPGPYDYSLGNLPDPQDSFMRGVQGGAAIQQLQQQQAQQAQAMQVQQQQARVINALVSNPNPTADDYARATLVVPGMREQLKQSWDTMSADRQQATLSEASKVHAALTAGQPQYASAILRGKADALKNSGAPQALIDEHNHFADVIDQAPDFARTMSGLKLMALPGGDKIIAGMSTAGQEQRAAQQAPADLAKKQADAAAAGYDATVKGVQAGNAPTKTVLDNQKMAEDIKTAQLKRDIDRLDVEIKGADSETKRGELTLQRDKLIAEQGKKVQDQAFGAQDAMDSLTRASGTVASIKDHPGLETFWSAPGTTLGPLMEFIPGTHRKDLSALVATLKSQEFLTQANQMRGMGALSDAEGARLEKAIASLDLNQSLPQFKNALGVIESSITKAQSKLTARGQLPVTGEAFVMRHPTYGNVTEGQVNALLRQHPGQTREQVLKFLQDTGGK